MCCVRVHNAHESTAMCFCHSRGSASAMVHRHRKVLHRKMVIGELLNATICSSANSGITSTVSQPSSPLPPGWEERQDANGRTFYLNHNARTTQWERPTSTSNTDAVILETQREDVHRRRNYESRWQASSDEHLQNNIAALDAGLRMNFAGEGHIDESTDDGGGPLPTGWDMQVAPNGRKFFIDHINKTTTWTDPRNGRVSAPATRPAGRSSDELGMLPAGWEERVHTDGRVFFIDHNTRRTQWEDPRFENASIAGPAVPYSRDYKCKYEYLRLHLPKPSGNTKCELSVRRTHVFEDSYRQIMQLSVAQLRAKLWIEFDGETGLDYGGVAREWFYLLSHHVFNPYYGLFEYSATDNYTLQINPHSETCNPEHISYFHFIGRVIGIAIFHGKLLDAFFIRPFYKMMLGKPITLNDMESVDNEYFNSLIYIKDNDPEDLDLYFAVDEQFYGQTQTVELREGGANEKVTEANKDEYIELVIKWRFVSRVEAQMKALMKGVHELVPSNLLSIFDPNELELLVCGLQKIDVKDWKDNTLYKGGYAPNHPVIHNFWKCILSFDNEMRARVLQFVTGTSRVPMNGFRELYGSNGPQKFTIEKWGNPDMLPRAHTCFNRMDLPPYGSFHELRDRLTVAIENSEIFSGVD
uniref:HECT-type E3 ubiquitin transferase n=1 Tax=Ascaris suum TaxID=6253 RepID=F1KRU4_ASCSU